MRRNSSIYFTSQEACSLGNPFGIMIIIARESVSNFNHALSQRKHALRAVFTRLGALPCCQRCSGYISLLVRFYSLCPNLGKQIESPPDLITAFNLLLCCVHFISSHAPGDVKPNTSAEGTEISLNNLCQLSGAKLADVSCVENETFRPFLRKWKEANSFTDADDSLVLEKTTLKRWANALGTAPLGNSRTRYILITSGCVQRETTRLCSICRATLMSGCFSQHHRRWAHLPGWAKTTAITMITTKKELHQRPQHQLYSRAHMRQRLPPALVGPLLCILCQRLRHLEAVQPHREPQCGRPSLR